jgi:hypothetical protein
MDLKKYRAWNLLRRTRKRALRRAQRRLDDLATQLIALRHHRVWGEPRLSDLVATGQISPLPHPHFIIIGAPKCGTSWLQGALGQHPNVIVVPDEIEYFSSNLDRYPLAWYRDLFQQRVKSQSRTKAAPYVVGEKSARYCSIPLDRIQLVRRLLPDVRLILMTRDPVARHWSHVKQYYAKPRNREREGGDVLSVPRKRLFGFLTRTRVLGEFSLMIANWTSVFPSEQLLIVSQEHALAHPRAAFDAVLAHLGVTATYDAASIRLLATQRNRGPSIRMPGDVVEFLEEMFAAERERLRELFGGRGIVSAAESAAAASRAPSPEAGKPELPEHTGRLAAPIDQH